MEVVQAIPEELVELRIIFDYQLQKMPVRGDNGSKFRRSKFTVRLQVKPTDLYSNGLPKPRPLWFAESQFLKSLQKTQMDGRLIQWKAYLHPERTLLSEYQVALDTALQF